jgi:ubiquinone/menaquinone biosynthesis C-methylase UbiE
MFEVAEAYEERMGREPAVGAFVCGVRIRDGEKVLDAGCGTGSLSATLASVTRASKIVGIDPSKGFIEYARRQVADPRIIFEIGDAQDLPHPNASFDGCMALLAIDHIPDAPKATMEMRRVTKQRGSWQPPCGTVAETMSFTAAFGIPQKRLIRQRNGLSGDRDRMVLPKRFHSSGTALV